MMTSHPWVRKRTLPQPTRRLEFALVWAALFKPTFWLAVNLLCGVKNPDAIRSRDESVSTRV
jgi:hypothetical protein